ncbi:MAG: hypothetical protein QXH33_01700 [Candidatus Nitrosocaldus sp.]
MQSNKEELKETLLDLLLEDKEFRHAVAGAIGYKEILDRFARVEEEIKELRRDMDARFLKVEEEIKALREEANNLRKETNNLRKDMNDLRRDMLEGFRRHDEEFAKLRQDMLEGFKRHDEEFAKMRQDMQEGFRRHDEELKRHWESIEKLRQDMQEGFRRHDEELKRHWESIEKLRQDMQEGFKRHDEELKRHWESIEKLRQDMQEGFRRHDRLIQELSISIGSLGRRTGKDMERMILNIYRDQLMQIGIDRDKARRFEYIDKEGLYGLKGKRYEFDIIVSNSHVDILEVKNRVAEDDIVTFYEKVNSIKPVIEREYGSVKRLVTVSIHIDREALTKAKELGVECIYGYIVRG